MVTRDEAEALRQALRGRRLKDAPPGFKAALIGFFNVDDAASFALADGDVMVLGVHASGLILIDSERDKLEQWTARIRFVPFDEVHVEVDYNDPHTGVLDAGSRPLAHAKVTVRDQVFGVTVTSEAGGEGSEPLAWVRALVRAKYGSAVTP